MGSEDSRDSTEFYLSMNCLSSKATLIFMILLFHDYFYSGCLCGHDHLHVNLPFFSAPSTLQFQHVFWNVVETTIKSDSRLAMRGTRT